MVIYEVTAVVEPHLIAAYENYMRERHIPDLIATGRFRRATISRSGENRYRICYEAHDQIALDNYLQSEAERLRADFLTHFPMGVEIVRKNWNVIQIWQVKNR